MTAAEVNGKVGSASRHPTTPVAFQRALAGSFDIFVVKFDFDGKLLWSTLVGGKDYDRAYAIEVDDQGYVYVGGTKRDDGRTGFLDSHGDWYLAGETSSPDRPVKNAFQATFAGNGDAMVAKLVPVRDSR